MLLWCQRCAFFWHAVCAAEVASFRQRYAEISVLPMEPIDEVRRDWDRREERGGVEVASGQTGSYSISKRGT